MDVRRSRTENDRRRTEIKGGQCKDHMRTDILRFQMDGDYGHEEIMDKRRLRTDVDYGRVEITDGRMLRKEKSSRPKLKEWTHLVAPTHRNGSTCTHAQRQRGKHLM